MGQAFIKIEYFEHSRVDDGLLDGARKVVLREFGELASEC